MRVYKITHPDSPHEFITNDCADLETFRVGSTVKICEMTEAEYRQVPATEASAKAFAH